MPSSLAEQLKLTGATNYNSRRLLEMYSNETVLKIADKGLNRKIDPTQAHTMAQELKRVNRGDLITVPSMVSKTGWKEMVPETYAAYQVAKRGGKRAPETQRQTVDKLDIYTSSSRRDYAAPPLVPKKPKEGREELGRTRYGNVSHEDYVAKAKAQQKERSNSQLSENMLA